MSYFRYIAFVGALCLLLTMFPDKTSEWFDYWVRIGGCTSLFWGGLYFLIRVDEFFYGMVAIIFSVLVQPFFFIPFDPMIWLIVSLLGSAFLVLSGLLSFAIEKRLAIQKARHMHELEQAYRRP